jgi:hypothetical protein
MKKPGIDVAPRHGLCPRGIAQLALPLRLVFPVALSRENRSL